MSHLIVLWELKGADSGLSGCVQDMSDSSQNNKRAAEMASLTVAHAVINNTPSALSTAVHVSVTASRLFACGRPKETAIVPICPHRISVVRAAVAGSSHCRCH